MTTDIQVKSAVKLSGAQRRVMNMMSHGWSAHQQQGCAIYINGSRVCNIDTMTVLERLGLIERDTKLTWEATEAGRNLAP